MAKRLSEIQETVNIVSMDWPTHAYSGTQSLDTTVGVHSSQDVITSLVQRHAFHCEPSVIESSVPFRSVRWLP